MVAHNLQGRKFGKLLVLCRAPNQIFGSSTTRAAWGCRCSCGKYVVVLAGSLVRQNGTRSCGCLRREYRSGRASETVKNRIFASYKQGAKQRNLEWAISNEEFATLIFRSCYYCGVSPQRVLYRCTKYRKDPVSYNGIDRVDNSLGYVSSNVVTCCKVCNKAKDVMSRGEFLDWIFRVAAHQRKS